MEFKDHLLKYLDDSFIDELLNSFSLDEHKGLILNTNKMSDEDFMSLFPNVKNHPVVPHCYLYNKNEYDFGKMIYHEQGVYYIQDPSASLVSYYLDAKEDEYVLDLCAAPGGKTTYTSLNMNGKGLLVSNDLSFSRMKLLLSNVERMGLSNVIVSSLDFSKIYQRYINSFDKIILDAPCSGSGMFRKMEEMKDDWNYNKVLANAKIQKDLILIAYQMLKPGGTLMYSTCSYSFEEDEEVIEYLLNNTDAELVNIPFYDGMYRSPKFNETIHLYPNLFVGEGHYIAKIHKPGTLTKNKIEPWQEIKVEDGVKTIYTLPTQPLKGLDKLAFRLGVKQYYFKGNNKIMDHHYSHVLDSNNSLELNEEQVVKYLKGESFKINKNCNEFIAVSYKHINLGVAHIINGELKNLYPKGLRRDFSDQI